MISRVPKLCIALVVGFGLLASLPALSAPGKRAREQQNEPNQQSEPSHAPSTATNIGERKFKQNCSRCHEAPQMLSPRVSGTVLRHMRVRASLSEQDERDILKFLNP